MARRNSPTCISSPESFTSLHLRVLSSANPLAAQSGAPADHGKGNDPAARIHRIEASTVDISMGEGQPRLRLTLTELMHAYNDPAFSIAVIDNFQIDWANGYGVTAAGSSMPVTAHTIFQAASISKPVTAAAALSLVEHGKLTLDEDVNVKLIHWKVPENELTKTEKVTLRRILSHSAGLTVHGFSGYGAGDPIPSVEQILNGEKPANSPPVRVDVTAGTIERYSGGGVTIEQLLLTDVTGKSFPALFRELVLDKLSMADSSFEQPPSPQRAKFAASATAADNKTLMVDGTYTQKWLRLVFGPHRRTWLAFSSRFPWQEMASRRRYFRKRRLSC
jgi:CubicO group peptidase (beta-lactamase class C family)